ncbi:hypothetical protein [Burkholderia contaminans]|uniref:hypothetical protein n=1 Tax=Burkholderia contaminans TaxID=488447 RepID=UPI00158A6080|nr:hypothetical protein [Burkholderia contaminans]
MRKIKLNKIMIGVALIGLAGVAEAQWQVDIPATADFTKNMAQLTNSLKASVDQTATMMDITRRQQAQLQADTDGRNRYALGEAAAAQRQVAIYPTLQACAELTSRQQGAGGMRAASSGGSSGGSPGARTPGGVATNIHNDPDKQIVMLDNKKNLDTCSLSDSLGKVAGCGGVGNYGGSKDGTIPASDVSSLSLKGNTSNADKADKSQELANYTIDAKGMDVANQYMTNATLYNAPKMLPEDKLKKNPLYKSLYDSVIIKLNGAQQAMKDIVAMRKAPSPKDMPSNSFAQLYWNKNKDNYETILGMRQPKQPSLMDTIMFTASNDYFMVPADTAKSQDEAMKDLSQKIALNNLIASRQLQQEENIAHLLALMLTQQVTPVDMEQLNTLYTKGMSAK